MRVNCPHRTLDVACRKGIDDFLVFFEHALLTAGGLAQRDQAGFGERNKCCAARASRISVSVGSVIGKVAACRSIKPRTSINSVSSRPDIAAT